MRRYGQLCGLGVMMGAGRAKFGSTLTRPLQAQTAGAWQPSVVCCTESSRRMRASASPKPSCLRLISCLYNTVRYTVQLYSTSDSVRQAVSELDGSTDAQPTRNIRYGSTAPWRSSAALLARAPIRISDVQRQAETWLRRSRCTLLKNSSPS